MFSRVEASIAGNMTNSISGANFVRSKPLPHRTERGRASVDSFDSRLMEASAAEAWKLYADILTEQVGQGDTVGSSNQTGLIYY